MVPVGIDDPRLAKHVQIVRLNDQASFAAGAALVAFVPWHLRQSERSTMLSRLFRFRWINATAHLIFIADFRSPEIQ